MIIMEVIPLAEEHREVGQGHDFKNDVCLLNLFVVQSTFFKNLMEIYACALIAIVVSI